MARWLAARARWQGQGRVPGRLVRLDGYPALVPSDLPDQWVSGDIYRLHVPARTLARLDRYENGAGRGRFAAYRRVICEAECRGGERRSAWVYVCNRPVAQIMPRMRSSVRAGSTRLRMPNR